MTALDDAERLLVSGSFERAKGEAAAARKDARSTSERVAAECVWIQAEYKLGGLTRHDLDAARMVTGFGEEFHRASVLLWSRLRLADPTDPAEAEAAAEKALTRIFERTLAERRKPKEDGDKDGEGEGEGEDGDAREGKATEADGFGKQQAMVESSQRRLAAANGAGVSEAAWYMRRSQLSHTACANLTRSCVTSSEIGT